MLIGGILPKLQNRAANGYRPHYLVQDGLTVLHALNDCMLGALAGRQYRNTWKSVSLMPTRKWPPPARRRCRLFPVLIDPTAGRPDGAEVFG